MLKRYATDTNGTSAIQYALILCLVAGGVLAAGGARDQASRSTLAGLESSGMPASGEAVAADRALAATATLRSPATAGSAETLVDLLRAGALLFAAMATLLLYAIYRRVTGAAGDRITVTEPSDAATKKHVYRKRQQIMQALRSDAQSLQAGGFDVRHLMSGEPMVVAPTTPLAKVRDIMEEKAIRHLLVTDSSDRLVGVISDRDVRKGAGRTAGQIMTPDPVSVEPHTSISPAITMMLGRRISCLPVVEKGKLVGVFTATDVMMALQCSLQLLGRAALKIGVDGLEAALDGQDGSSAGVGDPTSAPSASDADSSVPLAV